LNLIDWFGRLLRPAGPGRRFADVFRYARRAVVLSWTTNRALTLLLALLTLVTGALPAGVAWIGARIVDAVVAAVAAQHATGAPDYGHALTFVALEAGLVALLAAAQRGLYTCQSLLRAQLGQRVNVMILEKALTLELSHFEDSEFYDKLTRARREASTRPLSMVMRTFGLVQNGVSLVSYGVILIQFSPAAVAILVLAGLPVFFVEAKFSGDAFRLFRWRSPETRMQMYLESVIAREDHAKEVKLFGLGPMLLGRYGTIYEKLYREDRTLTLRRDAWGFGLGLVATLSLYGAYAWIAMTAIRGAITLGQMTMYLALFRQGQSALSSGLSAVGGLYEDNLYLSNLYEFLDTPTMAPGGTATSGPDPKDGVRFEDVSFTYPGSHEIALDKVTLHIVPGSKLAIVGENGSGKTTLIKLLTRLYEPTTGRITLDGRDLREWDPLTLHRRVGVIFQDFVRYQLKVGENIGAGDDRAYEDRTRWDDAAERGLAKPFITDMPEQFDTQLGKWFKNGRELSLGQWQKIALARSFMRKDADILVLDEPTASMDAEAEVRIFERFRELTDDKIAIVISHRFSTVRMADEIIVLDRGAVIERGSHAELVAQNGRYATLFNLQAQGYR
jgi:ATP-binding cassette subfamily B protein